MRRLHKPLALATLHVLMVGACCLLLSLTAHSAKAASVIKIGMVLPLSGPLASTGNDIVAGTRAAFDEINKNGGIRGQKIELLIEDDRFDPAASESLARGLVKTKGVHALLSCFGTVNCLAIAKVTQENPIALLGPMAGAESLRDNKFSRVYSVRANAGEEISRLLSYLNVLKLNTSPVVVQDDGFGKAYASSLLRIAPSYQFLPSSTNLLDPSAPDYKGIAAKIIAGDEPPPAVLLIANTVHSVGIIKALNDIKYYGKILNLAGQANASFAKSLSTNEQLAIFATVTPSPFSVGSLAAVAYRDAWRASNGNDAFSYLGFEAFLNAQVMIQALKRSQTISGAALNLAISQLSNMKYNELSYSFANNRRQAASYTDLAVLSQGAFKH